LKSVRVALFAWSLDFPTFCLTLCSAKENEYGRRRIFIKHKARVQYTHKHKTQKITQSRYKSAHGTLNTSLLLLPLLPAALFLPLFLELPFAIVALAGGLQYF